MKPILFLDIDGVLNEFGSQPGGGILGLQADKVARLKRILDTVPCDVVLSSTWRMLQSNLAKAHEMIRGIGYDFFSLTPEQKQLPSGLWTAMKRGDEIKAWLTEHPERTHFVVLDDDVLPTEFPDANQVHTDGFDGALTEEKADEVIRKLKATTPKGHAFAHYAKVEAARKKRLDEEEREAAIDYPEKEEK